MKLLVAEDDARIADFLERGLRAEGYNVQVARTGPEALAAAQDVWRDQPDDSLLLLDLMLPDMNGLEVCQTLRAAGVAMPILMLTALGSLDDRVTGLRTGADDYLVKPFEFEELLARIEALSRRGRGLKPARTAQLVVDDLSFDRAQMRASRNGRMLQLTARELALLELLMSAPGRLFSRERILATVWGTHQDPLTNVVDVFIRRLRAKIDDGHPRPLIHTVRGMGYRLEASPG
jgi:DNA-binding response OmpR family regulator